MNVGFFERPDPRLLASADRTPLAAVAGALKRDAFAFGLCCVAIAALYAADVERGLHSHPIANGTLALAGLHSRVTIFRDARDVPHIEARNDRDLYFSEGYVQGSDRLFQLDLTRRYAYGRLAEVLGRKALALDQEQRAVDIDGIASRQLRALAPEDRRALAAFAEGVNAAAATQPLPVEFRMLLYRPSPWTPKDSVAVSVVASLELAGSWHDVFIRDDVWRRHGPRCYDALFPLSDARYDVAIDGQRRRYLEAPLPDDCSASQIAARAGSVSIGSNAWAATASRSVDGRAIVANDPHLDLTIPGIWYLVDVRSPHVHAAGATIPGIPGVVLGHNERIAWASTNAEMTTQSVFRAGRMQARYWVKERFHVRFSQPVTADYYRTPLEFSVPNDDDRSQVALVRWPIYGQTRSTIATILALDRANSVNDALRVLARYPGSPQNFIVADRSGKVAYHVAGIVPDDPAWGRYVHPATDLRARFASISFDELPALGPSRDAILISANNKTYGPRYPYRLSAQFEPPYRAYRIAQLLHARSRYDAAYFARMQLDTLSPIDLELAQDIVRFARRRVDEETSAPALSALSRWDGRFTPSSHEAALEHLLRFSLFEQMPSLGFGLSRLRALSDDSARDLEENLDGALSLATHEKRAWADAGGMRIQHPLAAMNFGFLNGAWLPGEGNEYTIHLQEPGFAQGFRAVWDVGAWDRGGISIPSGESGEPGSPHYTDLTRDWVGGRLRPLPFGSAAIREDARNVLVLDPLQ